MRGRPCFSVKRGRARLWSVGPRTCGLLAAGALARRSFPWWRMWRLAGLLLHESLGLCSTCRAENEVVLPFACIGQREGHQRVADLPMDEDTGVALLLLRDWLTLRSVDEQQHYGRKTSVDVLQTRAIEARAGAVLASTLRRCSPCASHQVRIRSRCEGEGVLVRRCFTCSPRPTWTYSFARGSCQICRDGMVSCSPDAGGDEAGACAEVG